MGEVGLRIRTWHVAGLANLTIAQPLYEVLARNPDFFFVRRSHPIDIVLFVTALSVGVPSIVAASEWALATTSRRAAWMLHLAVFWGMTLLLCTTVFGHLRRPTGVLVFASALLALAATVAYVRSSVVRQLVTMLGVSAVVVPVVFLSRQGVRQLVFEGAHVPALRAPKPSRPVPIVMVVFDELPLTSLLDHDLRIDRTAFPNFRTLADASTWYRGAQTVHQATVHAVSSILTGQYPVRSLQPTLRNHPFNVFTLLNDSYDLHAFESTTTLFPGSEWSSAPLAARTELLLADASAVYLNVCRLPLPASWVPSLRAQWMNFWGLPIEARAKPSDHAVAARDYNRFRDTLRANRASQFALFLSRIRLSAEPALYFLHILLPHVPFEYDRDGTARPVPQDWRQREGVGSKWPVDKQSRAASYRRHLEQVRFVDRLVGQLLGRLHDTGLYDRCLLIVVADHGLSFRAGSDRREPDPRNYLDILPVPLFIKVPGQKTGRVIDDHVETVDIVPTIASVIGCDVPWPVNGRPLVPDAPGPRSSRRYRLFPRATSTNSRCRRLRRRRLPRAYDCGMP